MEKTGDTETVKIIVLTEKVLVQARPTQVRVTLMKLMFEMKRNRISDAKLITAPSNTEPNWDHTTDVGVHFALTNTI